VCGHEDEISLERDDDFHLYGGGNMVKSKQEVIVNVCWAWKDSFGELNREWHYEIVSSKIQTKELRKKYYDVKVVGRVTDDKIFTRGSLTRTQYRVMRCENGETFVEKLRVESGSWWYLIVKSDASFENINSFEEAEEAFKNAYVQKYPAHCTILYP